MAYVCGRRLIKPLFTQGTIPRYRVLACALVAVALMVSEQRFSQVEVLRARLASVVTPIQWLASLPGDALAWSSLVLSNQQQLVEENQQLRQQILTLSQRTQRMASLTAENLRLRELLHAAKRRDISYITAELLTLDSDPFTHQVVVDRGRRDGVFVGQPVMDASGIVGQVIGVSAYSSRVLLLADANHALPVQINRNGLRFIVQGTGRFDTLMVRHVSDTADIREGDLLISSGLAGRFPAGYPVARVSRVEHDPGKPFARVEATPISRLERARHFLLLFPPPPRDTLWDESFAIRELPKALLSVLPPLTAPPAEEPEP
ncbi:rod shape-determining protein MreC [Pistricoccus aurantiacus]|uniref:rod shape-determining protein MreC n=1 Tax=Pistricoccus aurantiacus TaxID=1883414 RepID=UPI003CCC4E45